MIYFDNAATSYVKPDMVKNEIIKAVNFYTANPGRSGHRLSQKTADKIFEAREVVKDFFNANDYSLVFTKNCTEAINLAIFGTLKSGDHVITTCYEHNSVLRPLEKLKTEGVEVSVLFCELDNVHNEIEKEIKSNTKMVITTMVSNVTGEETDVESVSKICKKHKLIYLVDGAQAAGHQEIDLQKLGVDMFAFAGHKGLLSVTGVGGLLVKNLQNLKPILYGGTGTDSENLYQSNESVEGFEAGTIPSIPIITLSAGVQFLKEKFSKILKKEQKLSEYLYKNLKSLDFLTFYSNKNSKNVFSFNVLDYDSVEVANYLNEKFSICVRAGLHCAPLVHKKLKTLNTGAVRVSLDFNNSFEEIDKLILALKSINVLSRQYSAYNRKQ